MHGGNGQIVEVVKSSYSIFPCYDEVQKIQSNKMTKYKLEKFRMSFSHIHNGVHTYITKRNVLHLHILQQIMKNS
jgi:hypothetical protein